MAYQVPMIEVPVTVLLDGDEPEEHFVYLAPYSERRDGPETLADYVNGHRRFFPMVSGGVARMVNRDQIRWLRYDKLPAFDPDITIVEKLAILELEGGLRIEGILPIDRPDEYSRISDVLNDASEAFLRVDDERETYFVNKAFIRSVIPR
jgi:hypothetical protein